MQQQQEIVQIPITDATTITVPTTELIDDDQVFNEFITDSDDDHVEEDFTFKDLKPSNIALTDYKIRNDLIRLSKDDLLKLFNLVKDPCLEYKRDIKNAMQSSPYKEDFVLNVLEEWDPELLVRYEDFRSRKTNGWLFDILYAIHTYGKTEVPKLIIGKYFPNHDPNFGEPRSVTNIIRPFSDLREREYRMTKGKGVLVGAFMNDLRNSCAFINSGVPMIVILEEKDSVTFISRQEFRQKLKEIKLQEIQISNRKKITVTGWDIYDCFQNSNLITYKSMRFYSEDPEVFSFFQGFQLPLHRQLLESQLEIIKPFLDHVKNVICNKNTELYRYLIRWLAYIVQNPETKIGTALVITGEPGTGKNTFTDTICKIFGPYANDNAKLDSFMGTFNSSILYKRLVVCNEVRSFQCNKNYDHDALKTLITEKTLDVHKKFIDVQHLENVTDFIFLSNNYAPVKIEENDRRFVVIETSTEFMNNADYFRHLYFFLTHRNFYSYLFSYLKTFTIEHNWNPHKIPLTDARRRLIEYSKPYCWHFIKENYDLFSKGITRNDAFEIYRNWCKKNNYQLGTMQEFKLGISRFCDEKRPWKSSNGERPILYKFKKGKELEFSTTFNIEEFDDDDDKQFNEG